MSGTLSDGVAALAGPVTVVPPPAAPDLPPRPYVGMRPLERNEGKLLFGRDDDVRFLCNKIFASPLTLLYAQSGIGKSSLLRSRVLAELEKQDAVVAYFESWTRPTTGTVVDPLKAALVKLLPASTKTANSNRASLIELVRRLGSKDEFGERHTVVLILDQLEEFLLQTSDVDPLRRELAMLLRAKDVDVRVVLSLREEFLAALEPFKSEIPTLFRSTYRLEPISDQAILEAITEPAKWFAGEYDLELPAMILRDLVQEQTRRENAGAKDADWIEHLPGWLKHRVERTSLTPPPPADADGSGAPSTGSSGASLPFIQLVCEKLWSEVEKRDKRLTLTLYRTLGGIRKILDAHVESVMPRKWKERELAARLLVPLAPATGLKMSYAAAELAQITGRDPDAIFSLLKELAKGLILRSREYGGNVRFELQHDALIGVVRPWRDEVLAEARRRKLLARIFMVAGVLLLIGAYAMQRRWKAEREYSVNTAALRESDDSSAVERAAVYLLLYSKVSDERRFDDLELGLVRYAKKGGGTAYDGAMQRQDPGPMSGQELRARVSHDYPLTEETFANEWAAQSRRVAERFGVPIPPRVRLERNLPACSSKPNAPASASDKLCRVSLSAPGGPLGLEFPWSTIVSPPLGHELLRSRDSANEALNQDTVVVRESSEGRAFVRPWLASRKLLLEMRVNGPESQETWWRVPRWTLPAWHAVNAAGAGALDPGALLARQLMGLARTRPELFFTRTVTESLLAQVAQSFPVTASEAQRVRGQRLSEDLVALVKAGGFSLGALPAVLDYLASSDADSGAETVAQTWAGELVPASHLPAHFSGARGWDACEKGAPSLVTPASIPQQARTSEVLPFVDPGRGIRVNVGGNASVALATAESAVQTVRRQLYEESGLDVPITLVPQSGSLRAGQVSFALADGSRVSAGRPSSVLELSSQSLQQELRNAALDPVPEGGAAGRTRTQPDAPLRAEWITAETVQAVLDRLKVRPSKTSVTTAEWLGRKYSLTDLKLLLRAVVSAPPPGNSARYPEWLLASLAYFHGSDTKIADKGGSIAALAQKLRSLQAAASTSPAATTCKKLDAGIEALRRGDVCGARAEFQKAAGTSEECFTAAYSATRAIASDPGSVVTTPATTPLSMGALSAARTDARSSNSDLTALLAWRDLAETPVSTAAADLGPSIWLFQRYAFNPTWQAEIYRDTIKRFSNAKLWPATPPTIEFIRLALSHVDPSLDAEVEVAKAAIGQVLRKGAPVTLGDPVSDALAQLLDGCVNRLGANWCRGFMFDILKEHQADLGPSTIVMALYKLMWRDQDLLAWYGDRRALEKAEELGDAAAKLGGENGRYAAFERNVASEESWQLPERPRRAHKSRRAEIKALVGDPYLDHDARAHLAAFALGDGDPKVALDLTDVAPRDPKLVTLHYYATLDAGDAKGAAKDAADLKQLSSVQPAGQLAAALSESLLPLSATSPADAEPRVATDRYLGTSEEQVPLLAALAANRRPDLRGDLDDLLQRMIEGRDLHDWTSNVELGQMRAWQEMLVALYLGKLRWHEAFAQLENTEDFKTSAFRFLGRERLGLLCQARLFRALATERSDGTQAPKTREAFDAVTETEMKRYVEYHIAKCISSGTCRSSSKSPLPAP